MARTDFFLPSPGNWVRFHLLSRSRLRAAFGTGKAIFFAQTFPSLEFSFARAFPWRGGIEFPVSKQTAVAGSSCLEVERKILILAFFAISEENDEKLRELLDVNINYEQVE